MESRKERSTNTLRAKREKPETGITTSVVRYEAGATFSEHIHPRGEEIFVLEGEFADEFGLHPEKPL